MSRALFRLVCAAHAVAFCCTAQAGLQVTAIGGRHDPPEPRTPIRQTDANLGGSTSVRNTDAEHLIWKEQGYYQRNRDLGQVFTPPKDFRIDAIVLRTGPSQSAVKAGAPGAEVFVQFFEVAGQPRINDNGTPPGTEARHGFSTNHRCDDYLDGVEYRSIRVVRGGRFPDLPPTRDPRGEPTGSDEGKLHYLRWDLTGEDELAFERGKRYAFMVGLAEPGPERAFTLANRNSAGAEDPPRLADEHDRYGGGWALRREGDGTLPPTMTGRAAPPANPAMRRRLIRESLFAAPPGRFELKPTTEGYPDVDTYRDLEFYIEVHADPDQEAASEDRSCETPSQEDAGLLEVHGRGVEGKAPYDGGGSVRFREFSMPVQVVHYAGGDSLTLPFAIEYEVLEAAPIVLTSRMGTEYWKLYQYDREALAAVYTDQRIDLSKTGTHTAESQKARFGSRYGPPPKPGLAALRGHYYLLIDPLDGKGYLDVVDPPPVFELAETARKLTFTLADLSDFSLAVDEVQSTWQPGGPLRVKLVVKDAGGRAFPVVNAPTVVTVGDRKIALATQWGPRSEPTGWLVGRLPEAMADRIALRASVALQTPEGIARRTVDAALDWGKGRVSEEAFAASQRGYTLPRDASGTVRETRAIWASTTDISTPERIGLLVKQGTRARLNVIIPDVFVRNRFMARSKVMPWAKEAGDDVDPLGHLIEKAHAAGLEVHPWFCVSYRDPQFCAAFAEHYGEDVRMIDADGEVVPLSADVHRPAYRKFITDLMVGVARDYPVDGIHLDYIRTKGRCFCPDCRREFEKRYGKPLAEASEDDWIGWQRQAIGEIVCKTAEGVRRVRPEATMSAAVFVSLQGGALQGQDPAAWARQGWMDLIIPMDYKMQTLEVRYNERRFLDALDDDSKLVSGLSLYMRSGNRVMSRPAELVREQIEEVRRLGIRGYCLFVHERLSEEQIRMLRDEVNREPARPHFRSTAPASGQ